MPARRRFPVAPAVGAVGAAGAAKKGEGSSALDRAAENSQKGVAWALRDVGAAQSAFAAPAGAVGAVRYPCINTVLVFPMGYLAHKEPPVPKDHYSALWIQGYLADKKPLPPRTIQYGSAYGPVLVLGGGAFHYERGTSVDVRRGSGGVRLLVREAPMEGLGACDLM